MSGKPHQNNLQIVSKPQDIVLTTVLISSMIFPLLSIPLLSHAQTPEWTYQYVNSDRSEWSTTIITDNLDNSYVTGLLAMGIAGGIGVIKLDSGGAEEWIYFNDTLGGGGAGYDMVFTDNNIFLTGVTGNGNLVVICVDTSGNGLWVYLSTLDREGNAIIVSATKNVYIAGIDSNVPSNWVVTRLDSLGNEKWRYVYDGPAGSYDVATDIQVDGEENIYVGGYSTDIGTSTDFTVIKLDSAGNEKWVYQYDGPASYRDELKSITLDTFGNIYMTGWSSGIGWDFCVVKIDYSGQEQWVYRYNGSGNMGDYADGLTLDLLGNSYVCGLSTRADSIGVFSVIKIDTAGNDEWTYFDAGPADHGGWGKSIVFDGVDNIYVSGFIRNIDYRSQIFIVKLDLSGDTTWKYIYPHVPPSPFADVARDITMDMNGNIYVTGDIAVASFDDDIVAFKFAAQGSIEEITKREVHDILINASVARNVVSILAKNHCRIFIYDILGRTIANKILCKNQKFDLHLQTGIYFVKVVIKGKEVVAKIVIIN